MTRTGGLITLPPAASDGGVGVAEGNELPVGEGKDDTPSIKTIDAERRFVAANCPSKSSSVAGGPIQLLE